MSEKDPMKTVEVAVITLGEYVDYECYVQMPLFITDWVEVTYEEAKVLETWVNSLKATGDKLYRVVHKFPGNQIPSLISECRKLADAHDKKKKKQAEERKRRADERKKAKAKKDKEAKRKEYERLKKEFESDT